VLKITIPASEAYDEVKEEFVTLNEQNLQLEHSLVSISKWESKWEKPFLSKTPKTTEEAIDYIRCMTLTQNVDPAVYRFINNDIITRIYKYIEAPMTATTISNRWGHPSKEVITAEIIYYYMITFGIPFECQKWHLNRLLTLIRVCDIKSRHPRKMRQSELRRRNTALNAARRKRLNTKG